MTRSDEHPGTGRTDEEVDAIFRKFAAADAFSEAVEQRQLRLVVLAVVPFLVAVGIHWALNALGALPGITDPPNEVLAWATWVFMMVIGAVAILTVLAAVLLPGVASIVAWWHVRKLTEDEALAAESRYIGVNAQAKADADAEDGGNDV